MNRTVNVVKAVGWELWLPCLLVALWWVASSGSTSFYWPALSEIVARFGDLWLPDHLLEDAVPSLVRLVSGFGLGFVVAVGLGLLLGSVPALEDATRPLVELMRALPSVALLPIMILLLGTEDDMKVVTIAFVATWPILLNTVEGVRGVEPLLHSVAASYRLSTWHKIRYVVVPAAMPQVFAGARVALSMSVVAMVLTEMVGSPGGLGYFVLDSQRTFDIVAMWTGLLVLGLIGYAANKAFGLVEAGVLSWHRGYTQQKEDQR
ncbi:ABC transporter permease [Nocardioides marmotae]|uniref:ABC transporter permease subunit n=1 Tax=Nocardioides marmotae TaxID=2663857 RepID=A0A6I3IY31_9ACTN|nr:ABC transporter permease [Nocardioides marmotae]MCR6029921.1 ABC transporter permease subunit [Gordonia jinghuaiqii]MBC9732877.1 ABC transporter permease [Nocardioides marmotae]MTB83991.1 ABC transporter permease subunit [Nocardioides marmotae]MTB93551.1 ABC transporter permease subunit [Nocardioides marmotae]QKD99921.1 ABC transporter permease [Nocardioides marmotae]